MNDHPAMESHRPPRSSSATDWRKIRPKNPVDRKAERALNQSRTSAVLDSTQVARTFEATPHRGGSPQVRLASGGSHGHSDVMDAYFSALPTAATQAFSWLLCSNFPLGHFLRQPLARLFAPKRDGRISHCCSPARTGRCGFPPRDNRRDKHRMLTRHSDADDGAAAHAMDCT